MEEEAFEDGDDEIYYPVWLTAHRGFVDKRTEEADAFDELLSRHLTPAVQDWTCDDSGWTFHFIDTIVCILNNELGQLKATATSDTMPRKYLDGMRIHLRRVLNDAPELEWSPTGFAVTLLQLTEEALVWLHAWKTGDTQSLGNVEASASSLYGDFGLNKGWNAAEVKDWRSILDNETGLNLLSVEDTAQFLLGEPIKDICTKFINKWKSWYQMMNLRQDPRILHIEPVFRNNLVAEFLKRKEAIHQDLLSLSYSALRQSVSQSKIPRGTREDTRQGLANFLSKPHVTFHGAPRHVIESIVRYGFIIPGEEIGDTGKTAKIRCGSSFGTGIYSSKDPIFAVAYADYYGKSGQGALMPTQVKAMKLVVCATLLGRALMVTRDETRRTTELKDKNAHSHVSPNKLEYVIFDSAQIVPCYVIHLDLGAQIAREEFDRVAHDIGGDYYRRRQQARVIADGWSNNDPDLCPGDAKRKKEAIKAAATKWFPYGFGSAEGTNFVIEEIGEVSDDEENFGEFQKMRVDAANEMFEYDVHEEKVAAGKNWFDEYQTVRKSNRKVEGR